MTRVKCTWSPQEMEDVIDFLSWFMTSHEPARLRLQKLTARQLLVSQLTATLCARVLLRLHTISLQPKPQFRLSFPPEYAQALVCAWLEPSYAQNHALWPLAAIAIGEIHKRLQ